MVDAAWSLGGVLIGGIITWIVAKWYYEKASRELNRETKTLRSMVNNIGRALENEGLVTLSWDDAGQIRGIQVVSSVRASITSNLTADGMVTKRESQS